MKTPPAKPKVSLWEHYGEYYNKLQTENSRMNLIWFLEKMDEELAKKVRALVDAKCRRNPSLDDL